MSVMCKLGIATERGGEVRGAHQKMLLSIFGRLGLSFTDRI